MTALTAHITLIAESVEKLLGYSTIVFDDIFALSKSAASKAISGSEVAGFVKPAVSKAAGVVVDDMTVVSSGVNESEIAQDRETAVWLKIVLGSTVNKGIVATIILTAGATFPLFPDLMLGLGACYLAYEGAHKVMDTLFPSKEQASAPPPSDTAPPQETKNAALPKKASLMEKALTRFLGTHPKERAVLQDLLILDAILSTEILLMANATLPNVTMDVRIGTLAVVSLIITIGVYGIVYAIIRADNVAESLCVPENKLYSPRLARGILTTLPFFLKLISVIGTVAMLGVAGEVAIHLIPAALKGLNITEASTAIAQSLHHLEENLAASIPYGAPLLTTAPIGLITGLLLLLPPTLINRKRKTTSA